MEGRREEGASNARHTATELPGAVVARVDSRNAARDAAHPTIGLPTEEIVL